MKRSTLQTETETIFVSVSWNFRNHIPRTGVTKNFEAVLDPWSQKGRQLSSPSSRRSDAGIQHFDRDGSFPTANLKRATVLRFFGCCPGSNIIINYYWRFFCGLLERFFKNFRPMSTTVSCWMEMMLRSAVHVLADFAGWSVRIGSSERGRKKLSEMHYLHVKFKRNRGGIKISVLETLHRKASEMQDLADCDKRVDKKRIEDISFYYGEDRLRWNSRSLQIDIIRSESMNGVSDKYFNPERSVLT